MKGKIIKTILIIALVTSGIIFAVILYNKNINNSITNNVKNELSEQDSQQTEGFIGTEEIPSRNFYF